ncbi:hypothetical protein [Cryocola sp. 340MFSha3.1]|uniref:hypothetical protein n=1 Tax=Cryocola sp. 340MFSha3.1 TaxID=1169145 RepID=UPI00037D01D1|nr:hypothetical protein [Cryocola sp. 340MFSha3.1]
MSRAALPDVGEVKATRVRHAITVALSIVAVTLLAGCAPLFPLCSMPDIRPPHITVDAAIWLRTHPGGTVHACYAGACDDEDGVRPSFEIVVPRTANLSKQHDLVVTLTDRTGTTTETARMALELIPGQKGAPCPMPDQWSRIVLVGTDGKVQVGGADDGRLIVPTPADRE